MSRLCRGRGRGRGHGSEGLSHLQRVPSYKIPTKASQLEPDPLFLKILAERPAPPDLKFYETFALTSPQRRCGGGVYSRCASAVCQPADVKSPKVKDLKPPGRIAREVRGPGLDDRV